MIESLSLCCTWQPFLFCLRLHENRKKIQQQPQNIYHIVKESNKHNICWHKSHFFSKDISKVKFLYESILKSIYESSTSLRKCCLFPSGAEPSKRIRRGISDTSGRYHQSCSMVRAYLFIKYDGERYWHTEWKQSLSIFVMISMLTSNHSRDLSLIGIEKQKIPDCLKSSKIQSEKLRLQ